MTDKYVIVYRDGRYGHWHDRSTSDSVMRKLKFGTWKFPPPRPAYRIRIREKANTAIIAYNGDPDTGVHHEATGR